MPPKPAREMTAQSIETALRTMCLWNGKTWETWESYKDRHGISELGYAGDMLNGGPVFLEKYTKYFSEGITQLIESERAYYEKVLSELHDVVRDNFKSGYHFKGHCGGCVILDAFDHARSNPDGDTTKTE